MKLLKLLFSFEGRIGRGQFWLAWAIYAAVVIMLVLVALGFGVESPAGLMVLQLIAGIPIVISLAAVGIKRMRDRNKSPWWLLAFYVIPLGLPFFTPMAGSGLDASPSVGGAIMQAVWFVVALWALVELGCLRGTIGGNPYGPDPVAPKPAVH